MFGRRWCRYARFSHRWGVLAKVVSCRLQLRVGCLGEGGVVQTSAEGGVFGRRCGCAHSAQRRVVFLAKVLPCSLPLRVGRFDRGVVVVHGIQRALPAQALLHRGHNINSHLLRPGVRPRPIHLPLPLSPRLLLSLPAPSPAPLETVVGRVGGAGNGKPVVGCLYGHGPLALRLVVRLDVTEIDLVVRFVRRALLGLLLSGRGSGLGDGVGAGVGGEAVVAVTGRRSVWEGVGSGGRSDSASWTFSVCRSPRRRFVL